MRCLAAVLQGWASCRRWPVPEKHRSRSGRSEQNVSEKISSLTQPAPTLTQPARGQPRKNVPKVVRAESPKQPDAASVPPKTPPTGTESLTEQPPRPPLPVPTAAEIG